MRKDNPGEKFIRNKERLVRRKNYPKWGKIIQEKNSSKMGKDYIGKRKIHLHLEIRKNSKGQFFGSLSN